MMMTDEELLKRIEAFLIRTEMAPTRFGREVMREASLITSLRNGRSLSLSNVNKVLKFMADYVSLPNDDAGSSIVSAASSGKGGELSARVGA